MSLEQIELKAAFAHRGCPLCVVWREAEDRYLWFFAREGTNDGASIKRLMASHGFCSRHTRRVKDIYWKEWNDALGLANTYQYLVEKLIKELEHIGAHVSPTLPSAHVKLVNAALKSDHCPACGAGDNTGSLSLRCLLENLCRGDISFRRLYEESDGLCLPHLRRALQGSTFPRARQIILTTERQKLRDLLGDLREYLRKMDYRYRDEPKGTEQDSWLRVLSKLGGDLEDAHE